MKITLGQNGEEFKTALNRHLNSAKQLIIFDLTSHSDSEAVLEEMDGNKYAFSHTRPISLNISKMLCNYEYIFAVEDNSNHVSVNGRIRPKKFVIGMLLLLTLISGFNALTYPLERDANFWFVYGGLPIGMTLFLIIDYIAFRRKIKRFIASIAM